MRITLKKHSSSLTLLTISLLLSAQLLAANDPADPTVEKKKTYTKSYTVNSNENINLSNQFGELKISVWDKNEVKADITITAEASTDEKAQAILDQIIIEDGKQNNGVFFRTKFNKNNKENKWDDNEKKRFNINYVVYVPAHNPLMAKNEFGSLVISDFNGEATLESAYGSLTSGKLTNVKKVQVEYGKAAIGSISNGNLVIKYSQASIDNLDGTVQATFEYCNVAKLHVDNDTKALTIKNNFSHLYLDLNTNISASFDINTNFGSLKNKTNFDIKEEGKDDEHHGPRFNKSYSGKTGSGNTVMKIKSDYGEITLGHNLNIDMKDNRKDRKREVNI